MNNAIYTDPNPIRESSINTCGVYFLPESGTVDCSRCEGYRYVTSEEILLPGGDVIPAGGKCMKGQITPCNKFLQNNVASTDSIYVCISKFPEYYSNSGEQVCYVPDHRSAVSTSLLYDSKLKSLVNLGTISEPFDPKEIYNGNMRFRGDCERLQDFRHITSPLHPVCILDPCLRNISYPSPGDGLDIKTGNCVCVTRTMNENPLDPTSPCMPAAHKNQVNIYQETLIGRNVLTKVTLPIPCYSIFSAKPPDAILCEQVTDPVSTRGITFTLWNDTQL